MKNKNKLNRFEEYTVYGLNGVKSILESGRYSINKIILSDNFDLNKFSYKNLLNKKYANKLLILNKNKFQNKYENLRTQGIVITFSYKLSSDFPIDIEGIDNGCYVILDSIKDYLTRDIVLDDLTNQSDYVALLTIARILDDSH